MGIILRFFLSLLAFYFLIRFVFNLLMGKRWASENKTYRQKQSQNQHKIQSQEDRIISYQKKKFESSTIEDVEFEEIKEK